MRLKQAVAIASRQCLERPCCAVKPSASLIEMLSYLDVKFDFKSTGEPLLTAAPGCCLYN